MKTAEEIVNNCPSVKIGIDDFYGKQTFIKAIELAQKEAVTEALRKHAVISSFSMLDLMLYYQDAENFDFTSKAIEVLNSMVNDR